MLLKALIFSASLVIASGLLKEDLGEFTPYKRALRQAAVLSDSWGTQSALLHTLTKDLPPDVIPERPKRTIRANSGLFAQDLEFSESEEFYNEYFFDGEGYSKSFFANVSMEETEPDILSCVGDGSNSTIQGYCKEASLCETFGGTAVGLCWESADLTAVCCQPQPGHFFPIPYLYEPEMDMRRLKRNAEEKPDTTDDEARSAVLDAGAFMKNMAEKTLKGHKKGRFAAFGHRFHRRLHASEDSLATAYALMTLYAAARRLMRTKYVSASTALSMVARTEEGNTFLESHCPPIPRCDPFYPYYTFDGSCNNIQNPLWGKSNTHMTRLLPPHYADGIWEMSYGHEGRYIGHPRTIGTTLFSLEGPHEPKWSMFVMTYGQLIAHDLGRAPELRGYPNGEPIACCDANLTAPLPRDQMHVGCSPMYVPPNDEWYGKHNVRCLSTVRSVLTVNSNCYLSGGYHANAPTAYLDASMVYGNDKKTADKIRAFKNGQLLSKCVEATQCKDHINSANYDDPSACPIEYQMMPTVVETCTQNCEFLAGDMRANENPSLVVLHTVFLRQHNFIAKELSKLNPHWDDEKVYQEARKIVTAQHQYITFYEYLKVQFGEKVLARYNRRLDPSKKKDFTRDHNPLVQPGLYYEFSTSADRYGHSQCMEEFWMPDKWSYDLQRMNETAHKIDLVDQFHLCEGCCNKTFMNNLIIGLMSQETYTVDSGIEKSLHGQLFKPADLEYGHDLVMIDLNRGRDHGMKPYARYVEYCHIGNKPIRTWEDLHGIMAPEKIDLLRKLYYDVSFVELYPAGFLETTRVRNKDDKDFMGPTFLCLLLESFLRLKISDRLWFSEKDRPGAFTADQLTEIYERGGLARMFCNTFPDLGKFPSDAFLVPFLEGNPLLDCSQLPTIDLTKWKEPPPKKISGGVCVYYTTGRPNLGTCLPKELCGVSYDTYPAGSYQPDQCRSPMLRCCSGFKTVLNAHIGYSEPNPHQLDKFFKSTQAAVAYGAGLVDSSSGIRKHSEDLSKAYDEKPESEKFALTEPHFAIAREAEVGLGTLVMEQAFKYILGKFDKSTSPSLFYGVQWNNVYNNHTCLKEVICDWKHPYRTPNGVCNRRRHPEAGVGTGSQPMIIPVNSYSDGIASYPTGQLGPLPNARSISLSLFKRESRQDASRTLILPYITLFLLDEIFQPLLFKGSSPLDCCNANGGVVVTADNHTLPPGCNPVIVPEKDPLFGQEYVTCLPVLKNLPGAPIGCSVQPDSPINRATGWLSLSLVYGPTVKAENRVRAFSQGLLKLKTQPGDVLPVLRDNKRRAKLYGAACGKSRLCRNVGSPIANSCASLHPWVTLWAREHNRIAKHLHYLNPHWTDGEIFHEAKAINIGQWQAIVLKEVIPAIIGRYNTEYLRIRLQDVAYNVHAHVAQDGFGPADIGGEEVLRAVYMNTVSPIAPPTKPYGDYSEVSTRSPIFLLTPDMAENSKQVDLFFQSLVGKNAEAFDNRVFEESQGTYKYTTNGYAVKMGYDLLAEQIQGSRVDGHASYNDLRKACGFLEAYSFSDFADTIKYWQLLGKIYASPKDVDGVVGIMMEKSYPDTQYGKDSLLGGVGVCLLAKLVRDWMTKDRFLFNNPYNPRRFTQGQIHAISQRTMAGILCDNTENVDAVRQGYFKEFPRNVFLKHSKRNPILSCYQIPRLQLDKWRYTGRILAADQNARQNTNVRYPSQLDQPYPKELLAEE